MAIPTNPETLGKPPFTCVRCKQPAWLLNRNDLCCYCQYPNARR